MTMLLSVSSYAEFLDDLIGTYECLDDTSITFSITDYNDPIIGRTSITLSSPTVYENEVDFNNYTDYKLKLDND